MAFDDAEAFLHDFDFTTIIDKFSVFFENTKPQKGFKIVKNFFFAKFGGGYQTRRKRTFAHLIIIWGRSGNHSIDVFSTVFLDKN